MNIQPLFSTVEREKIFTYLIYHFEEGISLHKIAREVGVSPSQVHKYVSILKDMRFVQDNKLLDSPLIRSLRLVENLLQLRKERVVNFLKKSIPSAEGIGIYGSWAKGSNTGDADLDIWIKVSKAPDDLTLAKTRRTLEKKLGVVVDLTPITPEKFEYLKKKNPPFYFSLCNSTRLWGEKL